MDIKEYCSNLGSTSPTPGGGSACGIVLALAASCAEKACRFSINDFLTEFLESFVEIREKSIMLSKMDEESFIKWGEARKLPKETDSEKKIRNEQVNYYTAECVKVPYEIARHSLKLIEIIQDFIPHCNKWLISDALVGASFARSSFESAIFNIDINLPLLKDEELKNEVLKFIDESSNYIQNTYVNIIKLSKDR